MMQRDPAEATRLSNVSLRERAYRIRRNAIRMGEVQGQGYIAQALGIADVLAVSYFGAMRYRSEEPEWEERDRFLLSCGHYAIALYSVLIEAGLLPEEELETYGSDDSRLPMSAMHHKLDNLIAIVDVNNMQADGPSTQMLGFEPLLPKFEAFGWYAQRVDGNDIEAVAEAFDRARALQEPRPRIVICDTRMAKGVPFLEVRERSHFLRVEPEEWQQALEVLDAGRPAA
jgi:transketolase